MKYRLTKDALGDVRQITRHIRFVQQSQQNAKLVSERLRKQFATLAEMPNLGHRREEIPDENVRVISVSGLLVLYDPFKKPLTILRVIHGARDLSAIELRKQ